MDSYIAQRLATLSDNTNSSANISQKIATLEAENAQLKEQLKQAPQAEFKSESQKAFENSPEFESILNIFYMRFMRDKFGTEFRSSPHMEAFQVTANQAFTEFEKNIKKGDAKNAQNSNSKKISGTSNADNKQDS